MATFDFIIAGGGVAGLSLAYHMAMSPLNGRSILVVEREIKEHNDHTWGFWLDEPSRLDHLVYHSWEQAEVISDDYSETFDARPYQFKMIRAIDYYHGLREALQSVPGIQLEQGRVDDARDTKDKKSAQVTINEVPHGASWAFDSTFKPSDYFREPRGAPSLKRHFKGWEIVTPADCFDPRTVTLFDFRTPQKGAMRFFHILPLSRRHALVEYTIYSTDLLKPHEYDRAISEYLENVRHIPRYRTESVETGAVPMTRRRFPRRLGQRVMAIGTKGGLVKPSTGDAFQRIQKDSLAIVRSLTSYGDPFQVPAPPARSRLVDTLLLRMLRKQGGQMGKYYLRLFQRNPIQQVIRFFDEETTLAEDLRLLSFFPTTAFLTRLIPGNNSARGS